MLVLSLAAFAPPGRPAAVDASAAPAVSPGLRGALRHLPTDDRLEVVVRLRGAATLAPGGGDRATRQREVVLALRSAAEASRGRLGRLLEPDSCPGCRVTPLWVINGLAVSAPAAVVEALARHPEVASISLDETVPAPVPLASSIPEANLAQVNAPALWALGFRGQGVVVASLDTGVDATHPDLAGAWRGGGNSWYDPNGEHPEVPVDGSGHGTWTMGVIVGGDAGGTQVGVAPEARWITVKIFGDDGSASLSAIHLAYQWLLDPDGDPGTADAPHVVNNSWTFGAPGCNLEFEPDLRALRAAGILPIFAAGNFGPDPATSASPANNPGAFAVGALDDASLVYARSSRGPGACGAAVAVYPRLVAPGVGVRSPNPGGGYAYASGTSLAAPHVAGALALLLSAFPDLSVAEQEDGLLAGASDLGAAGPDDASGYGRLDVLASYSWLLQRVNSAGSDGPSVRSLEVQPAVTRGNLPLTLRARLVSGTPSETIIAAECWLGPDGTPVPLPAVPPDLSEVALTTVLPAELVAGLGAGDHAVFLRAQDSSGRWGAPASAGFGIDLTPPVVGPVTLAPGLAGSQWVTVEATAADPGGGLQAAEVFLGELGRPGQGQPMAASDGSFGGETEVLAALLPAEALTGLPSSGAAVFVRARDAAGNWSAPAAILVDAAAREALGGAQPVRGYLPLVRR